jgi:hypothetical protein
LPSSDVISVMTLDTSASNTLSERNIPWSIAPAHDVTFKIAVGGEAG